ncbi:hypothetical protein RYX36_033090, partial [Vicia faba]
ELNCFQVRKRPNMDEWVDVFDEIRAIATQHDCEDIVPLALPYAKNTKHSRILALSNKESFASLFDTSLATPKSKSREFSCFQVRKQPNIDKWVDVFDEIRAINTQHDCEDIVPLALPYAKTTEHSRILSLSNEESFVSLFDTSREFALPTCYERKSVSRERTKERVDQE